jgi:hypothetical protein
LKLWIMATLLPSLPFRSIRTVSLDIGLSDYDQSRTNRREICWLEFLKSGEPGHMSGYSGNIVWSIRKKYPESPGIVV